MHNTAPSGVTSDAPGPIEGSSGDVDLNGDVVNRYSGPLHRPFVPPPGLDDDLRRRITATTDELGAAQLAGVRRMLNRGASGRS